MQKSHGEERLLQRSPDEELKLPGYLRRDQDCASEPLQGQKRLDSLIVFNNVQFSQGFE